MVDDKAAHLQSEFNRLAAELNAEPVKVGVLLDNDNLNIFIDDGGRYHYSYWERGADQTSTGGVSVLAAPFWPAVSPFSTR
jgi:hypothetical protein